MLVSIIEEIIMSHDNTRTMGDSGYGSLGSEKKTDEKYMRDVLAPLSGKILDSIQQPLSAPNKFLQRSIYLVCLSEFHRFGIIRSPVLQSDLNHSLKVIQKTDDGDLKDLGLKSEDISNLRFVTQMAESNKLVPSHKQTAIKTQKLTLPREQTAREAYDLWLQKETQQRNNEADLREGLASAVKSPHPPATARPPGLQEHNRASGWVLGSIK